MEAEIIDRMNKNTLDIILYRQSMIIKHLTDSIKKLEMQINLQSDFLEELKFIIKDKNPPKKHINIVQLQQQQECIG